MQEYPIINKKMVRLNRSLKTNQKEYKRNYDTGSRRMPGNVTGKLVRLYREEPVKDNKESVTYCTKGPDAMEMIAMTEQQGLKGMSGNGFPVAKKLQTFLKARKGKGILIVNAMECDPGLLHDEWILKNKEAEVWMGIDYLKQAFGFERIIIAVKMKSRSARKSKENDTFRRRKRRVRAKGEKIEGSESVSESTVCNAFKNEMPYAAEKTRRDMLAALKHEVQGRYPMGEEHFLIKELLGVSMNPDDIPARRGILVMNVQTVFQIGRMVNGLDTKGHYVTLANLMTGEAKVAYVMPEERIIPLLKAVYPGYGTYYAGHGVLAAHKVSEEETFCDTIGFAAIGGETGISDQNLCKKCGACARKCPMGISVKNIVLARQDDRNADVSKFHPELCMHCGSCTFYCHASKNVEKIVGEGGSNNEGGKFGRKS
ncbi:MAG: 4Fe-4S dicluster domain-containing protein [Lachnospiraceae bacterium]|nr:4Fe-4S dicluster domain-containing protein [Lachnospiraceae bacterium]